MGLFSFTQEIAMDLGTANSIIIHNDKIVVDEPSVVAIENKTDKVLAVGTPAHQMEGKESPGIRTVRPLRNGWSRAPRRWRSALCATPRSMQEAATSI